jgi:hypothetical protein
VAHVIELLQRTMETTRSLTVQLSRPVLREIGRLPALQWLAGQCLESRGVLVKCDFGAVRTAAVPAVGAMRRRLLSSNRARTFQQRRETFPSIRRSSAGSPGESAS